MPAKSMTVGIMSTNSTSDCVLTGPEAAASRGKSRSTYRGEGSSLELLLQTGRVQGGSVKQAEIPLWSDLGTCTIKGVRVALKQA